MKLCNGEMKLGGDLIVKHGLAESAFLSTATGSTAIPFIMNGVHRSYTLKEVDLKEKKFSAVLFFQDGILTSARLYPLSAVTTSWATATGAEFAAEQMANSIWLATSVECAPPYAFAWGSIANILDEKSATCFILFRYHFGQAILSKNTE